MDNGILNTLVLHTSYDDNQHFKVKKTSFVIQDEQRKMLQIIDETKTILNQRYKMESQSLEMANACVSHELRNPLACIVSCSI